MENVFVLRGALRKEKAGRARLVSRAYELAGSCADEIVERAGRLPSARQVWCEPDELERRRQVYRRGGPHVDFPLA